MLIDEHAEAKLAQALETLKTDPRATRCIYFRLAGSPLPGDFKAKLFELAQRHFTTLDAQIYFCGDGDIFILIPVISIRERREFILDVAALLNRPAGDEWVGFYEVALQVHKLLLQVEQKLDRLRQAEEERRKLLDQHDQERKRQAILSGGKHSKADDIRQRREEREKPELMMIEDDAFTRRLVENVLQKHYSMTGLGEATHALNTYARLAPDVLFLDINLPDVTGHELLEKIIALDPAAYVIMLSGNCDRENIVQAMSKGAKGFIAKPFTRDKLFQYIDRCPTISPQ